MLPLFVYVILFKICLLNANMEKHAKRHRETKNSVHQLQSFYNHADELTSLLVDIV